MRSGLVVGSCRESAARQRSSPSVISAKRRAYNREYMRAWRADPRHQARERATRERAYYERKLREALRERSPFTNDLGLPVCGFCGKLPPIAEILRLRVCDHARSGYVQVRIPYCGQC
jgi:hypothetical protein